MRILDVHCDVGHWAFRKLRAEEVPELLDLLASAGISAALVGPVEAICYRDPHEANQLLLQRLAAAGNPPALLPAASISPAFPGWQRDLEWCLEAGVRAVKLYPNYHGYRLSDRRGLELGRALSDAGIPVLTCFRVEDERQQHPLMLIDPVDARDAAYWAEQFPDIPLIIACANQREIEAFLRATDGRPNTWADISYLKSPIESLEHMVGAFGAERLMAGTHAPFLDPAIVPQRLEMANLPDEAKQRIAWENAAELFQLK